MRWKRLPGSLDNDLSDHLEPFYDFHVNILKLPGAAQPEQKASTNEQSARWLILCFLYKQETKTHGNKSDAMIHDVQLYIYITSNIKSFSQ